MARTQTFVVDLERLQRQGNDAQLVIRLMRAADDIALANWCLGYFSQKQPRLRAHLQQGARRYFVRLQCGHLAEGLEILEGVRSSRRLRALIPKCESFAQEAFHRLLECTPGGARRAEFESQIRKIRNKAAFHYDSKLVARALASRAGRPGSSKCTITRGTELGLWRSGLADDIEDTIICRLLWKIPFSADVRAEADRIAAFGAGLCRDFLDFSGELSFRYLRSTATA